MKSAWLAISAAALGFATPAWCFPEMVRYGYANCISCHTSPSGGGVLSAYGREISRDILSTWGTENESESKFAWGLIPQPNWLATMGEYRGVYAYQNTPFVSQGQYIYMQGDVEATATVGRWYGDVSLGYENKSTDTSLLDHVLVRRAWLGYQPTDQFSVRFGRFYQTYGINTPDHVIPTRRSLGFDEGQESINLEGAYLGSKYNVFLTGCFGRPDYPTYHAEQGVSATASMAVADTYKVGVSYLHGDGQDEIRNLSGPWGILGFTKHFFLLSEWDLQETQSKSGSFATHLGAVNYQKLDYEILQGLHLYLSQDFSQLDFQDFTTLNNSYGLGIQFFPRPHFEINMSWQKLRTIDVTPGYTDFAWLMINLYI